MKATLTALLAAVVLFVAPGAASAQMTLRDRLVFDKIADQVNRYTQYTIFDSISASVENGRVVLTGWVTMPYKRDDLEQRVRRVDGVVAVENGISVLPVSHLRRRAAVPHRARDLRQRVVLAVRVARQPADSHRRQPGPRSRWKAW